ncbi:MAG: phosphatase PAP2 family protein [Elusimicrobia bacterium]|nr:phosphatase PAP2 family protein [Elusimicrobiota bacterium]
MKAGLPIFCLFISLQFLNNQTLLMAWETPAASSAPAPGSSVRIYKAGAEELAYSKPAFWANIADGPRDWLTFARNSFSKKSLPWLGAIGIATVILIEYDQKIYDNTRRFGKKMRISTRDKTRAFITINGVPILRGPTDVGSAMYFLGDGWINIGLCGYFEVYGRLKDDWRALTAGHQLVEGLLLTGFTTQLIKRATGRETPRAAHSPRGVWRPFPSFADFQGHRSRYDAMPSGHMATGMMTITVLAANYPEKKFIKPLGYGLLGLLGFQMVNNGVHWISDYPLGLAAGYSIGKVITANGKTAVNKSASAHPPSAALRFCPVALSDGTLGPGLLHRF